jgi:hypothetical protein
MNCHMTYVTLTPLLSSEGSLSACMLYRIVDRRSTVLFWERAYPRNVSGNVRVENFRYASVNVDADQCALAVVRDE